MFIREHITINKKTGATYVSHRLVESYRSEKGPRQRVVMHLGTLKLPKASWPKLAAALEARLSGHVSVFEEDQEIAKATAEAMSHYHYRQLKEGERRKRKEQMRLLNLDLGSLAVVESRTLGPELVAYTVWQQLEMDELLANLGFTQSQCSLAQSLVLGRLLAPELEHEAWFRSKSALGELLHDDFPTDTSACRKVASLLLLHKEELEEALWKRELELFGPNNHLILFGLSSIVILAMDSRGFPSLSLLGEQELGLAQMDQILERQTKKVLPTVTLHRDLATEENLKLLSCRDYPHLLVWPSSDQTTLCGSRRAPVQIQQQRNQAGLCIHCTQSSSQELDEEQEQFFLEELDKLQAQVAERKLSFQVAQRRLAAVKEQFPQVATHYQIELGGRQNKIQKLFIQKQPPKQQPGYVFQTYEHPLDQREVEAQYQTLTRMVTAFCAGKLVGEANLFLSVLAYHLMVVIEHQLEEAGCSLTWQDVQAKVSTHQRITITFTDDKSNRHRIRSSTMPAGEQNEIYRILQVEDTLKKIYFVGDSN
jgi:hypothetical protein